HESRAARAQRSQGQTRYVERRFSHLTGQEQIHRLQEGKYFATVVRQKESCWIRGALSGPDDGKEDSVSSLTAQTPNPTAPTRVRSTTRLRDSACFRATLTVAKRSSRRAAKRTTSARRRSSLRSAIRPSGAKVLRTWLWRNSYSH